MAKIILPGKKSLDVDGKQKLSDLKISGLVPKEYALVRKDPQTGAVQQLKDEDIVADNDLVFATPKHIQG